MWIFVLFDLPVETKLQRYNYSRFRKFLLKDGFDMLQFSVYIRPCTSYESVEVHTKRIVNNMPDEGKISIMTVTDKQFENIKHYWGATQAKLPSFPRQLEMF